MRLQCSFGEQLRAGRPSHGQCAFQDIRSVKTVRSQSHRALQVIAIFCTKQEGNEVHEKMFLGQSLFELTIALLQSHTVCQVITRSQIMNKAWSHCAIERGVFFLIRQRSLTAERAVSGFANFLDWICACIVTFTLSALGDLVWFDNT